MPIPGNISVVWVRGKFLTDTGAPMVGSVRFTRSAPTLIDQSADIILCTREAVADLDVTGAFTAQLIVSDDPDVIPTGFTYTVVDPTGRPAYPMLVPAATPIIVNPFDPLNGQRVIELSDVVPLAGANAGTVQLLAGPAGPAGPAGATGPAGPAGTSTVTLTAGVTLSGHRMVTKQSSGTAIYADNTTPGHIQVPLWMTLAAASSGASVSAQASGVVDEPTWSWTPGPLYLGANGVVTQSLPASPAFLVQIGYATSATSIVLDRQPSLVLI